MRLCLHDWGAAVGLAWAAANPARVERIVVVNGVPLLAGFRWRGWARAVRTPLVGPVAVGFATPRVMRRIARRASAGPLPAPVLASAAEHVDIGTERALLKLLRSATPESLAAAGADLGRVLAPALVLWGAQDPWIPARFGAGYAATLGDATLETIEDAGHWPWLEKPELERADRRLAGGRDASTSAAVTPRGGRASSRRSAPSCTCCSIPRPPTMPPRNTAPGWGSACGTTAGSRATTRRRTACCRRRSGRCWGSASRGLSPRSFAAGLFGLIARAGVGPARGFGRGGVVCDRRARPARQRPADVPARRGVRPRRAARAAARASADRLRPRGPDERGKPGGGPLPRARRDRARARGRPPRTLRPATGGRAPRALRAARDCAPQSPPRRPRPRARSLRAATRPRRRGAGRRGPRARRPRPRGDPRHPVSGGRHGAVRRLGILARARRDRARRRRASRTRAHAADRRGALRPHVHRGVRGGDAARRQRHPPRRAGRRPGACRRAARGTLARLCRDGPPRRAGAARAARRPRAPARLLAALSRGARRRARERRPVDRRGLLRAAPAFPRRPAGDVPRRDPVHREPLGGGARRAARTARARLGAPARPPLRRAVLRRHADRQDVPRMARRARGGVRRRARR